MAVAVALTAWLLWPKWLDYRDTVEFERVARELRAGITTIELLERFPKKGTANVPFGLAADGSPVALYRYCGRSHWYFVCLKLGSAPPGTAVSSIRSQSLQVYRLDMPPEKFQAQTQAARDAISPAQSMVKYRNTLTGPVAEPVAPLHSEEARRLGYSIDFFEVINGRTSGNLGMNCERIHSDPPSDADVGRRL